MEAEYGILDNGSFIECVVDDYVCTFLRLDDAIEFVAQETTSGER